MRTQLNQLSICSFSKDISFKFTSCSENFCELAGEDSPSRMLGKEDFNLLWHEHAAFFREKDIQVIKKEITYVNMLETTKLCIDGEIKQQQLLVTKIPIINEDEQCIGIAASAVIMPADYSKLHINTLDNQGRFWLSEELSNEYLTKREVDVLKLIVLGKTSKQIACLLKLSYRTVEGHTDNIRKKFQCSSKYDFYSIATKNNIPLILAFSNIASSH